MMAMLVLLIVVLTMLVANTLTLLAMMETSVLLITGIYSKYLNLFVTIFLVIQRLDVFTVQLAVMIRTLVPMILV